MEEMNVVSAKKSNPYLIPATILISAACIAGVILYLGGGLFGGNTAQVLQPSDNVRKVSKEDHVRGNPKAKIKIVEYSDFDCPFCKSFHDSLNAVIAESGPDGDVAWVYRHFPLERLHPNARNVAIASECANELNGNDGFWNFADRYFELKQANLGVDIVSGIATELGFNMDDFNSCLTSGRHDAKVDADIQNARDTGGTGTPWSIVIAPNGKTFPISGSQPKEAIEQIINIARNEK